MIKVLIVEDNKKEMTRCKKIAELFQQELDKNMQISKEDGEPDYEQAEIEFCFASSWQEAVNLLPGCQAVITDLYFPGPSIDKEKLVKALRKYPYCNDVEFSEELPFGLLLALRARKENKPVMFVSSGVHHSDGSNFLTMMCREGFFNEGFFFEGISPKGYKKWMAAFNAINTANFLYFSMNIKLESFYKRLSKERPENSILQDMADIS